MSSLHHFSADTTPEVLLKALRQDGAVIIDRLVSPEKIAAIRAETDTFMDATPNGADDFSGFLTTRTGGLVARSPQTHELITHPLILSLCDGFLLENCERYQLHLTQIIRLRPSQPAQVIHRDKWAWGTHLAHLEPQLNTIWAISDFTAENGATQIVPGSSSWPDDRQARPEEITQAEMESGSVLVYSGSVFHGGGENRSNGDRIAFNLTYALGWLRQEENQYLSTPPEIARSLPRPLQELLGYAMGQYALGYYTPPGAAGDHPDIVPPQYALGYSDFAEALGDPSDLEAIKNQTQRTA